MDGPRTATATTDDTGFDALTSAVGSGPWQLRLEAVERVRDTLRTLPKPPTVLRLAGILDQAGRDPKWEVRRAVADSLDLLPDSLAGELEARLRADKSHDVRTAVERVLKRRKRQAREERRLDNQSAQAASRIARLEKTHGPEVARAAEEAAWDLLGAVVRPVAHDLRLVLLDERGATRDARAALSLRAGPSALATSGEGTGESLAERERRWRFVVALVGDLTEFSDPKAPEPERVPLREAVEEALGLVRGKLGRQASARVGAELEIDPTLTVQVPRGRLLRALTNLLKNAFESIEAEGQVRVTCDTADRRRTAVLRIADTGRGIPKADLGRVFLPGVTSKRAREGWSRHTGWGLAIARRCVERDCRGRIEVASVLGRGTTFTVELPIVKKGEE